MCLHTTKGIDRSIGEREMSDIVHSLESGLDALENDTNLSKEKFEEVLLVPQRKVFQLGKELFFCERQYHFKNGISSISSAPEKIFFLNLG